MTLAKRISIFYGFFSVIWLLFLHFLLNVFQDFLVETLFVVISTGFLYYGLNQLSQKNELKIEESNQRFQRLVESMDDIIFTLDKEQRHTGVYGRWLEKAGLRPEFFLMKSSREIFGEEQAHAHETANQKALGGESVVYEWAGEVAGSKQYFQTRLSPIWDEQKREVIGIVGIGRDITRQYEIEAQLEAYQQSLEELVASRTQELRQSNERLQAEIIEREKARAEAVYQAKLAESLREISSILNRTLDLNSIFQTTSELIGRLLPHDSLTFMLHEDENHWRIYAYPDAGEAKIYPHIRISHTAYFQKLMEGNSALRLNSKAQLPNSAHHKDLCSALSAPICFENEVLGFIHLGSKHEAAFKHSDESILESFCSQIAIAVHNAQQYQNAQEYAAVQERGRIARDLHDAVTQTLFSANLVTETLLSLPASEYEQAHNILKQLQHLTKGALAEMRALLLELRPQFFENAPLDCLIQQLTDAFYSRSQIPVEISGDKPAFLNAKQREIFYRIVQEALNNIDKHARAQHVWISICVQGEQLELSIRDDGIGFQEHQHSGLGLGIMRERAEQIGAELKLESSPTNGTSIRVNWSIQHE